LSVLSSLNPVSETARGNRFWVTACWYVGGAVAGGSALGAACAVGATAFGRLQPGATVTWSIALAGAAVAVASDSALVPRTLPVHPRQVDERWLGRYRRWIYAGGYGVQIGSGFATYIMTGAVYLTALLAVLSGGARDAVAICMTFGLVRGLGVLVTARVRTPVELRDVVARVDRLGSPALRLACGVEAAVAVTAAWVLGGPLIAAAVAAPLVVLVAAHRTLRRATAST
jgi:hypothetical protein